MNTSWAPKPLRPPAENPLFEVVDAPTVVKGLSPIQRQRLIDGTPHTITGPTALRAADPTLVLPETMIAKGSLVEKYDDRSRTPKKDPEDPISVVKSYLDFKGSNSKREPDVQKSLDKLHASIQDVLSKTGTK